MQADLAAAAAVVIGHFHRQSKSKVAHGITQVSEKFCVHQLPKSCVKLWS